MLGAFKGRSRIAHFMPFKPPYTTLCGKAVDIPDGEWEEAPVSAVNCSRCIRAAIEAGGRG
jgi:hypothetical protein